MNNLKIPQNKNIKLIENLFKSLGLDDLVKMSKEGPNLSSHLKSSTPFKPDLVDLFRLYQYISLNKRTTILEFGSGWSSLVFVAALNEQKKKYSVSAKKLRRDNLFELFILENEKKYLNITKKNIQKFIKKNNIKDIKVNYVLSKVKMLNYNGNFATEYENLPNCNPDFIYLDGPGQFNIQGKVNNFTISHNDMMPMSCDLLKLEFFLIPGTILIVDGRGANSNYLKHEFKRKWTYKNDKLNDQNIFYLKDQSFGKINNSLLNYYSKNKKLKLK